LHPPSLMRLCQEDETHGCTTSDHEIFTGVGRKPFTGPLEQAKGQIVKRKRQNLEDILGTIETLGLTYSDMSCHGIDSTRSESESFKRNGFFCSSLV